MKPLTVKDLRDELKSALKENNQIILKEVKREIKTTEVSVKKYIGEYVGDAADKILNAMQEKKQFEEFKSGFKNYPVL